MVGGASFGHPVGGKGDRRGKEKELVSYADIL